MLSHLDENAELIIRNRSMNLISRQTLLSLVIGKAVELRDDLGEQFFNICLMVAAFGLMLSTHFDKEDEHELYFQQLRIEQLKGENTEEKDYINEPEKMMLISTKKPRRIPKDYYKEFTKYTKQLTAFIKVFKRDLKSIDIKKQENGDVYECELNLNYGKYSVNEEFESTGIKKLIELFNSLMIASLGGIVFIDELDSNADNCGRQEIIERI
ncbi:hypothetical protein [Butyrivibrio sp. LC3010]|uniref:hypothetical protein n=1 Tax=Butyrivibrio sp. LC3010 TaxID=1280680 RepID=UPI0003F9F6C5|nr:hypothetical protein [Butyrivibrio sp. LC3010]